MGNRPEGLIQNRRRRRKKAMMMTLQLLNSINNSHNIK
jgi:hypothetical protein